MEDWIKNLPGPAIMQILETAFPWFVVVDRNAKIIYLNEGYCNFLEVKREDAIGKHVADVIENSEMHLVIEKGHLILQPLNILKVPICLPIVFQL